MGGSIWVRVALIERGGSGCVSMVVVVLVIYAAEGSLVGGRWVVVVGGSRICQGVVLLVGWTCGLVCRLGS